MLTGFHQVIKRSITGGPDGCANAAAARGNFSISGSGGSLFEFVRAVAGKDRMRVGIDKARQHDATPGVDYFAF